MTTSADKISNDRPALPEPRIAQRQVNPELVNQAMAHGLHPVAARVFAARIIDTGLNIGTLLRANIADLDPPHLLKDVQRAAVRIATAVRKRQHVVLFGDYDCDGMSSLAAAAEILLKHFRHPRARLDIVIGNRFTDGYGLTDSIAQRILALDSKVDILVTMDCGSGNQNQIAMLASKGIDVIVTDHHGCPSEGPPRSAYATVNPTQPGCGFPDKNIAGCHTVWLVMAATRQELIAQKYLPADAPPLNDVVDYVALSTVADCVSIASKNNRAVVRAGLKRINAGVRPAWRAIRPYLIKKGSRPVTAETLAFGLAPRINAPSRIQDPMRALKFLLADDDAEASRIAALLDGENEERRSLERELTQAALREASDIVAEEKLGLSIFMPDGHIGLSGLVASRLVEAYGRPSIVFAPKPGTDLLVGSARSIAAMHLRECLQDIQDNYPGLLVSMGGHHMAAGATIALNDANLFLRAFDMAVRKRLSPRDIGPVIWTDGELKPSEIHLETIAGLAELEPYGREFEQARFFGEFLVCEARPVGADQTHLQLLLRADPAEKRFLKAIWFRARLNDTDPMPVNRDDRLFAIYELTLDDYRGNLQPALRIVGGKRLPAQAKAVVKRYI